MARNHTFTRDTDWSDIYQFTRLKVQWCSYESPNILDWPVFVRSCPPYGNRKLTMRSSWIIYSCKSHQVWGRGEMRVTPSKYWWIPTRVKYCMETSLHTCQTITDILAQEEQAATSKWNIKAWATINNSPGTIYCILHVNYVSQYCKGKKECNEYKTKCYLV